MVGSFLLCDTSLQSPVLTVGLIAILALILLYNDERAEIFIRSNATETIVEIVRNAYSSSSSSNQQQRLESFIVDAPHPGPVFSMIKSPTDAKRFCEKPPQESVGHVQLRPRYRIPGWGICSSASTGNYLSIIYLTALEAFQRNATFELMCSGGSDVQASLSGRIWYQKLEDNVPNLCWNCSLRIQSPFVHLCPHGLNYAVPMIQNSLRQATASIPSTATAPDDAGDAVLHFRCGDILKLAHTTEYGYPKYSLYKRVFQNPSSIAIVTAPWDETKCRGGDCEVIGICRAIVLDMVDYLQTAFPNANIHVRNNETILEDFRRIINAKQIICNPSTFCLYPALAAYGESYIIYSAKLYPFVDNVHLPNVHVLKEEFLNMKDIVGFQKTGIELAMAITSWMRNSSDGNTRSS